MTDEIIIEAIKSTLDRLEKATNAGVIAIVVAVAAAISSLPAGGAIALIDLGVVKVPLANAGIVAFLIFLVVTIHIFRSLSWIEVALSKISDESKARASWTIRNHLWFFNPFFEGQGRLRIVADNVGLFLLITLWWSGAYSGLALLARAGFAENILGVLSRMSVTPALWPAGLVYMLYLLVGAVTLRIIWKLVRELSTDERSQKLKLILNDVGAIVGAFGVGAVFFSFGVLF
jgi:hypothetical protein